MDDGKMQKLARKYGSVLKAYRSEGGRAVWTMMVGSMVFIGGTFITLLCLLMSAADGAMLGGALAILGLLVILIGEENHRARIRSYLDFYQSETGYSAEELYAADRELMGPEVVMIVGKTDRGREKVMFMITEHYFMSVWPNMGCYLVKLEDIVAVFHFCQIPIISVYLQGLCVISKRDVEGKGRVSPLNQKQYGGYFAITGEQQNVEAEAVCMKALEETAKRVPHVIRRQYIVANGKKFDLLSLNNWQEDWARILRA